MIGFAKLQTWRATSLLTLGIAGLLFGLVDCRSYAQQEPNRQLLQTNTSRPANERCIALVIGNGAYTNAPPLKNPPNDARDMAATLKTLGFDVSSGINLSQREMKRLIREFGQKLKAGGNGLFYYAGHGVQARGRNYIIPVDAEIQSEADVEDSGVDVGLVLNYMDDAQNGLNIVILDACRNNPFARSFRSASDGLAQVDAPTGTLIAYATAPGRVAADGAGDNGLYTSELLKAMRLPGLSATDMFMQVRAEVMKRTGNKQVPWEASSLVGTFYFTGGPTNSSLSNSVTTSQPKFDSAAFEYNYWDSIKNSNSADSLKAYLAKYPEGQFAGLAKIKLKELEVVSKPSEPETKSRYAAAAEIAFWDSVKNSADAEDFRAYLKKYPNGEFAELAKNRLTPLEVAIKEKEKEEEAKRLAAEAAKPIKTFKYESVFRGGALVGNFGSPYFLIIFHKTFEVRPDTTKELTEFQRQYDALFNCEAFKRGRLEGQWIREIHTDGEVQMDGVTGKIRMNAYYRFRFESAAAAADALADIQRICKATP